MMLGEPFSRVRLGLQAYTLKSAAYRVSKSTYTAL